MNLIVAKYTAHTLFRSRRQNVLAARDRDLMYEVPGQSRSIVCQSVIKWNSYYITLRLRFYLKDLYEDSLLFHIVSFQLALDIHQINSALALIRACVFCVYVLSSYLVSYPIWGRLDDMLFFDIPHGGSSKEAAFLSEPSACNQCMPIKKSTLIEHLICQ